MRTDLLIDFLFLPLIGALHGWLTNFLAIKLLFFPEKPIRLPFGLSFQGVIPKRKADLAHSIGKVVEEELLRVEDLLAVLAETELETFLISLLDREISDRLEEKLPRFIPSGLRTSLRAYLRDILLKEVASFAGTFLVEAKEFLSSGIKIGPLVEERLNAYEVADLERLVSRVAGRELRHIILLGIIMGGWIGLTQGLFLLLLRH